MQALSHFLDYGVTHPNAIIRYHASDMVLWLHNDTGYNNTSKGQSRSGGIFDWETNQQRTYDTMGQYWH